MLKERKEFQSEYDRKLDVTYIIISCDYGPKDKRGISFAKTNNSKCYIPGFHRLVVDAFALLGWY
jgi:hypothetical protein